MNLLLPVPGIDPGPDYANNLNSSLTIIDGHNHTPGNGVQITPAGININADLPMNGNNLTLVKTINFQAQVGSLPGSAPNLGCVYVGSNELYYNDEVGNVVQITNMGSVNAGAGSITGLPSGTASASYQSGSGTFVFQSATNTPANVDGGSFIFREQVANAKGITVSSPSALAADYGLNWPAALPGAQNFMTLDSSGNIAAPWNVDNSTIEVSSNIVRVKALGINTAQLADGSVTRPKLASLGQQISSGCGNFSISSTSAVTVTNLTVTITTSGRPVMLMIQPDSSTSGEASIRVSATTGGSTTAFHMYIERDATADFGRNTCGTTGNDLQVPVSFSSIDTPSAGTHTYVVWAFVSGTGPTGISINNAALVAYEL